MEWMNRGDQRQGQPTGQQGAQAAPAAKQKVNLKALKSLKVAQVALLFSVTVLIVALAWFVALGGNSKKESSHVDKSKLQAVFLNGGQVYFGNISDLNGKFLSMKNIYYLRVNQQVQPNQTENTSNDISLVKLGCELHGPQDSMVINREQIIFWENLKDDGQVAKAVANYKEQNPGEQKCETNSSNSSNSSTTPAASTPDANNTSTGTNNSTSTPATNSNSSNNSRR